jgi:hypothetical protein
MTIRFLFACIASIACCLRYDSHVCRVVDGRDAPGHSTTLGDTFAGLSERPWLDESDKRKIQSLEWLAQLSLPFDRTTFSCSTTVPTVGASCVKAFELTVRNDHQQAYLQWVRSTRGYPPIKHGNAWLPRGWKSRGCEASPWHAPVRYRRDCRVRNWQTVRYLFHRRICALFFLASPSGVFGRAANMFLTGLSHF